MFKIKNFSIVPKFFILLLDLGATLLALFIAILIQFNVTVKLVNWGNVVNAMVLITLINSLVFIVTKSYTGIVRYTGVQDALRILLSPIFEGGVPIMREKASLKPLPDSYPLDS